MTHDDHDDLLDDGRAELEARFRELEQDAEIERLRRETGRRPAAGRAATGTGSTDDDLSDLKASLDDEDHGPADDDEDHGPADDDEDHGPADDDDDEEYLLVLCPACGARNRTSLRRVRTSQPLCGRCKETLSARR